MCKKFSVLLLLAVLASAIYAQAPSAQPPSLGKLVDIGGYRLHLYCTGRGKQTVILAPGGSDFSFDWYLVQSKASSFARVCSYDRAGSAWSDPGPEPRTLKQEAYELHLALHRAHERGPYILVGHSIAGLVVRIFADLYPKETAGMVLVDALSPDGTLGYYGKLTHMREIAKDRPVPEPQTMKSSPPKLLSDEDRKTAHNARKITPPYNHLPDIIQELQLWAWSLPPQVAPGEDYLPEEMKDQYQRSISTTHPLGDRPLISVIGMMADKLPPGMSPQQWDELHQHNILLKRQFASLSTNSKVVEDKNAGHSVHLDDPDTVVIAIHDVLNAAQQHSPL